MRYIQIDLYTHQSCEVPAEEVEDTIAGLKKKVSKNGPVVYSGEESIVIVIEE